MGSAILLTMPCQGYCQSQPEKSPYAEDARNITERGLAELGAYAVLKELTTGVGNRLSGSPNAARAVHHTVLDTIDKVNPRELELGAIAMSIMLYLVAQEGL